MFITIIVSSPLVLGVLWVVFSHLSRWEESFEALSGVTIALFCISTIAAPLTYIEWIKSEHQALVINREFGTNYTQEDIFWASDVIEEIKQLNRSRHEINGDLLKDK